MKRQFFLLLFPLLVAFGCQKEEPVKKELANELTKGAWTFNDFENKVTEEMKYEEIVAIFGEPLKDIGSGIHIYVYELADGTEVWIGYADKVYYVRHEQ